MDARRIALAATVAALAAVFGSVSLRAQQAITFQYIYDEAGQLTKVVDSTGVVIEYVYDAVGNMLEVRRSTIDPSGLTILDFTPAQGGAGTLVTVRGLGFSPQLAANAVTFNGAPAPVVSAASNLLLVSVPLNATTGPIRVTTGTASAHSATPFVVLPIPVITSVQPRFINVSGPPANITVTGANLGGAQLRLSPVLVPAAATFGPPQANAAGTLATVPISVHPSGDGQFVIVASTAAGASTAVAHAGNTLMFLAGR